MTSLMHQTVAIGDFAYIRVAEPLEWSSHPFSRSGECPDLSVSICVYLWLISVTAQSPGTTSFWMLSNRLTANSYLQREGLMKHPRFRFRLFALSLALLFITPVGNIIPFGNPQAASFAKDIRFANGTNAIAIPLVFSVKGHMFVRVRVNNSEPLLFGLDSGFEQTAITTKQAKALGLKTHGESKAAGVGEGEDDIAFARNVRFDLPGVNFQLKEIGVLALDFPSPIAGEPIAGILGYDFISRFVVKINYADKVIDLHSPLNYLYHGRGEILPIRMIDNYPSIPATVTLPGLAPIKTLFVIDTGAESGIFFNSPFVKSHKLLDSKQETKEAGMLGVGGTSKIRIGRADSIRLGRTVIPNPVVHFSLATKGEGADALSAGQISNEILRHFKIVIFDHARRRLILEAS
jgi:aspartyl protease